MISQPITQDLHLYRGRDFKRTYELKDSEDNTIDLTDWSFDAEIRPVFGSDNLIATFNTSTVPASGTLTISMDWETTKEIDAENPINVGSNTTSSNMVWDLLVNDSNDDVYSLLQGKVIFHETATVKED